MRIHNSTRDNILFDLDEVWERSDGDVNSPQGCFTTVYSTSEEQVEEMLEETLGSAWSREEETDASMLKLRQDLLGFFLLREDDQGFQIVTRYDRAEELEEVAQTLADGYREWSGE